MAPAQARDGGPALSTDAILARLDQLPGIDVARGLTTLRGKKEKYVALMRQFALNHGNDMARFAECLAQGEHKEALRIPHTLKGVAGTMGATSLAAAAYALDAALNEVAEGYDEARVTSLAGDVANALQQLVAVFDAAVEPQPVASTLPVDRAHKAELLTELGRLLAQCDTRALAFCHDHGDALRCALGNGYDVLLRNLQAFDFDAAEVTLAALTADAADVDRIYR